MGRVGGAEWRKRKEDQGNLVRKLVSDSLMDRRARRDLVLFDHTDELQPSGMVEGGALNLNSDLAVSLFIFVA